MLGGVPEAQKERRQQVVQQEQPGVLARHFPETRSFVFNSLLKRSAYERVEFSAHVGTVREARASEEISARFLVEDALQCAPCVLRQKDVEVKQFGDRLVIFRKKRMLFWVKANGDEKAQAASLVKRVDEIWKRGRRACTPHGKVVTHNTASVT